MKCAVYPGTFDPITYGHIDVIEQALSIFDRVIVAIAIHAQDDISSKRPFFTLEERVTMVKESLKSKERVEVDTFEGLLVDYLRKRNVNTVIRGLRAVSDFDYEFQMAMANRRLFPQITVVFLMPREEYFYLSSSMVREIAAQRGDVSHFVPPVVQRYLVDKFRR